MTLWKELGPLYIAWDCTYLRNCYPISSWIMMIIVLQYHVLFATVEGRITNISSYAATLDSRRLYDLWSILSYMFFHWSSLIITYLLWKEIKVYRKSTEWHQHFILFKWLSDFEIVATKQNQMNQISRYKEKNASLYR